MAEFIKSRQDTLRFMGGRTAIHKGANGRCISLMNLCSFEFFKLLHSASALCNNVTAMCRRISFTEAFSAAIVREMGAAAGNN